MLDKTHNKPCTCPIDVDTTQCYVWIHRPTTEDRVVTFNKILEAYKFGIELVFAEKMTSGQDSGWAAPEIDWSMPLCEILTDISHYIIPLGNHWQFIVSDVHQVLIGLGSTLPAENIGPFGYTLEAHDKPEDMPALFYSPQQNPEQS